MAFGQSSGPPASKRDVDRLLVLLRDAGHVDFRDARGPMGFNQRQAAGKFTRDEVAAFVEQLEEAEHAGARADADEPVRTVAPRLSAADQALRKMPTERLAAELQRRGWIVVEP